MSVGNILAWTFGPYLLIQGLWMFVQKKNLMKICESTRKSPGIIYVTGWTNLLIGLVLINLFNVWEASPAVCMTLLGWAYTVRALVILFIPQIFIKLETHERTVMPAMAILRIVWGILLVRFAMMSGM